jgi:hypothetical protein
MAAAVRSGGGLSHVAHGRSAAGGCIRPPAAVVVRFLIVLVEFGTTDLKAKPDEPLLPSPAREERAPG